MENRYHEGDIRTLMATEGEKVNLIDQLPPQTERKDAAMYVPGGYQIEPDGKSTVPGVTYLTPSEATDYLQYEIKRIEEELATTTNVNVLKKLQIVCGGHQELLKQIEDVEPGEPLDFEVALSAITEPLLDAAGFGLAPQVASQAAPGPDRLSDGAEIFTLQRGSRSTPAF